ncbi:hypothetical protein [Streptomyces sp. NPDC005385]|uniref:hypothetical protein n=1 Tax=Streptomyces sp. NPDC005385 TaxID=3157039 RepID=UPI0033BC13BD
MTHNHPDGEPSRTFALRLARARRRRAILEFAALAHRLAGPVVLCSGCLRPCAECGDGCNDALAAWTTDPTA